MAEPHEHRWDEIDYELPRTGGMRKRVGWFCVVCGEARDGYDKPTDGVYAHPEDFDDDEAP